ncbi:hypothetical protein GGR51DRAFT_524436 [Nemania sp. FL0031]|nr:hypothetical protein GGR51DRAFT_524436 [Nemania sp. FL0031]
MRFASFFAGTALSCVVQGLAINHVTRNDFSYANFLFSSDNFCGKTTFQHTTSSKTPTVDDCKALIDKFNSGPRQVGFEFIGWDQGHLDSGYLQMGSSNTCAFGAKPIDANDGPPVVTWGDAADAIKMALGKLAKNNMIEGMGTFECQVPKGDNAQLMWTHGWDKRKFQWQIYAPGTQDNVIY